MRVLWYILMAAGVAGWSTSCKPGTGDRAGIVQDTVAEQEDEGKFFSIKEYLEGQRDLLAGQPYVLLKVVEKNGKSDSSYIDGDTKFFEELNAYFAPTDISDNILKNKYGVEQSHDFGNAMLFLYYNALDEKLLTQKVQLSIHDETFKVLSVYIETNKSGWFKSRSAKLNYNTEKSVVIQEYEKSLFSDPVTTIIKYYYSY